MTTVTFIDETTAGARDDAWALEIFEERLPLRELIRRRIFQEVAEFNAGLDDPGRPAAGTGTLFRGLVQPSDAERTLNGYRLKNPRRIDPEQQCARALEAFGRNGFLVLVGDRQILGPDEEIELAVGVEVTFLKLVPLVGG
ncbi:MAG TPA: hypothetical protein VGM10_00485 [Actinocrinis sp.]|jgi:hypothetical protein